MGTDSIDESVRLLIIVGVSFLISMLLLAMNIKHDRPVLTQWKRKSVEDLMKTTPLWVNVTTTPRTADAFNTSKLNTQNSTIHSIIAESDSMSTSTQDPRKAMTQYLKKKDRSRFQSLGVGIKRRFPSAIIIGASRSGVSALARFLRLNQYIVTVKRENNFFTFHYSENIEWYREKMPFTWPKQITVDKNPNYYLSETVALRLWGMDPKILLILVVRNPIDRAISGWLQENSKGNSKSSDTIQTSFFYQNKTLRENHKQLRLSLYASYLKKYIKYFSFHQIHVVNGDVLRKKPGKVLRTVEHFLGFKPSIRDKSFVFNKKKGFFCYKQKGRKRCLGKGRTHPHIEPWMLNAFKTFFRPHNKDFFELLGRSFPWD